MRNNIRNSLKSLDQNDEDVQCIISAIDDPRFTDAEIESACLFEAVSVAAKKLRILYVQVSKRKA